MRKFEVVNENMRKILNVETILPTRSSKNSAGYDFRSKIHTIVKPNEIVKIWTDIKAQMEENDVLMLFPRSSMSGKFMLANTIGIVDSDYYSNKNNDGNIGIFLINISNENQEINVGDRIAQGVFLKYEICENDESKEIRIGGFGSSGV